MLAQVYCYVMSVFIKLILLIVLLSIPNSEADAFIPVLLLLLKESSYFFFFIIFLCAWVCMFVWMSSYMSMCKGKQKTTAGLIPQAWYIFFLIAETLTCGIHPGAKAGSQRAPRICWLHLPHPGIVVMFHHSLFLWWLGEWTRIILLPR